MRQDPTHIFHFQKIEGFNKKSDREPVIILYFYIIQNLKQIMIESYFQNIFTPHIYLYRGLVCNQYAISSVLIF